MNPSGVELRWLEALPVADRPVLGRLFREAGWIAPGEEDVFLAPMVAGSFLALGAYTGEGRLVGFGNALSDGVSDAYLQNVVVDSGFRGQGIGGRIVEALAGELRRRGVDWIALVGAPGTETFYRRLGWRKQDGFVLWQPPESAKNG